LTDRHFERYTDYRMMQFASSCFNASQAFDGTPNGTLKMKKQLQLTDAFVRTLAAPETGRIEVRETGINGFALRVTEKGAKSWVLIYHLRGRKGRLTLGSYPALSLADARRQAHKHYNEIKNGNDPAAAKRSARTVQTVAEAAEIYIERWAKPNKRTWTGDQWMLNKHVLPFWRDRKVREIQRTDVIALLERIAKTAPV
jgi:hypothetical protein